MRNAFTLIEVIVAAGIIAIVGLGLLQVHGNNTKLITNMSGKYRIQEEFSLILLNANKDWHHSGKTLYDFISQNFTIKDDDVKSWLKKYEIDYEDKEFSKIDLLSKAVKELSLELEGIDIDKIPELKLVINKVSMTTKDGNGYGYTIGLE